jgi:hypothetical protein
MSLATRIAEEFNTVRSEVDTISKSKFVSSGVINKQDDSLVFNEVVGNEYKLQDNSMFFNFDGKVVELPNGIEIDMTDNMPEVFISPDVPIVDGDYQVDGNTIKRLEDGVLVDRTQFGITNKILATMREDGTIKTEVCFVDTDIEHLGNAHIVMTDNGYIRVDGKRGLYTKDGDVVTPIGTWSTLNKGAFHPVYNYFGCVRHARYENSTVNGESNKWHDSSIYKVADSTSDVFTTSSNGGSLHNNYLTAGYGSSGGVGLGRLDNKFYDIIYPDQWIDLRIEANAVSESDELNRVGTKAKSGQLDGIGGVVAIKYLVPFELKFVAENTTHASFKNASNNSSISFHTLVGQANTRVNLLNVYHGVMFSGELSSTNSYIRTVKSEFIDLYKDTSVDNHTLGQLGAYGTTGGWYLIKLETLPHPSSGTALRTEILANPDRYSDDMKAVLASGNPLLFEPNLVDDTGASNIPDGSKATFKLNNKFTTTHQVLKSSDKGVSWSPLALTTHYTVNTVANTITFTSGNIPSATDMIMISNKAVNTATQVSDPKPVKLVGNYVTATNSHSIYKGNQLVPTGKVNVGGSLESRVVENVNIINYDYIVVAGNNSITRNLGDIWMLIGFDNYPDGTILEVVTDDGYGPFNYPSDYTSFSITTVWHTLGLYLGTPSHSTISLDNSDSPAVKFIETIAEDDDGMAHYQVFAQEIEFNTSTSSYDGDDGEFTKLTNSTTTDDNDKLIKTIVASIPLNKYIGA